jgi:hypothetical protein
MQTAGTCGSEARFKRHTRGFTFEAERVRTLRTSPGHFFVMHSAGNGFDYLEKITPVVSGCGLFGLLHLEQGGSHGFVFDLIS